ncbi:hypothetical protein vBYenPRambo_045 [Yersinia phage vB_YenP_Rambo]|uniref:Uncharacterized protein n=1 Tax=Yersinia phage vB_YenP_Rambo TaxID=2880894 RepID=A0AC61TNT6_9CAUD|nr:hypothetical protein vBYenPRambo_045 [Yersinia phage vB_YenP_Rambo]
MAILYRSNTVWSYTTGRVAGGDHLPTGELYRGFIYFRHINSIGDMHRLSIILSDGTEVKIHHEQEYAGNDRVRIYRRGMTQDGYHILEVVPQVQVIERLMGVRSVDMQAYFKTSEHDYNALSHASFKLWESSSNGGVTLGGGSQRIPVIDERVEHAWYNELVDLDGEVIKFDEHAGDRLVIFSFNTDVVPADTAPGADPFVQWTFQLRRTDNTILATSPTAYIAAGGISVSRQVDLTAYIRGDDDPLIMYGVIPELINNGSNPVKFKNAFMNIYTVDTPKNPYLVYHM